MLKGILAISGHSGLFKLIAETKNNIIVESLSTGKRYPVYSSSKISALDDIAIYSTDEDVPLKSILKTIFDKEKGGSAIRHDSPGEKLKAYFAEVLPDYDRRRVYVSDMKKVMLWYGILLEKGLLDFSKEEPDKTDSES